MKQERRLKVLLIAPYFDRNTPGESRSTFKWVEGISAVCETTVLSIHRSGWDPADSPTKASRLVDWTEPKIPGMQGRIAWELKPGYVFFYFKARGWIHSALRRGESFDLMHQINPLALRYPSPARGCGIPYLIGPLAGSLETPAGFDEAAREKIWFRKLRSLDRIRLARDPWLKSTYSGAAAVIGVAPYVRELLAPCAPPRFEIMAETGVEDLVASPKTAPAPGQPLRLLFVGRLIRTKGILDGIRALARCAGRVNARLDIIGTGDLLEECKSEADKLGIADRVTFHGRLSRDEVFEWYRRSHVFLFPSFREPSGNVVFEAMSQGLPVITSTVGGPGYVVEESCGISVTPDDPESYASRLAEAIEELAEHPERITALSAGALRRMEFLALWPCKIDGLLSLYTEVAGLKAAALAAPALVPEPVR
ncbi:MAG: glycosyltransferase family 4 protein [Akkermansiaceae bacterium]|jgi:glycosyltransferase involved in cell wall biosynthesis|nr:glycosyltransferase family 4 protein [Akkermansiaceae bacterium]